MHPVQNNELYHRSTKVLRVGKSYYYCNEILSVSHYTKFLRLKRTMDLYPSYLCRTSKFRCVKFGGNGIVCVTLRGSQGDSKNIRFLVFSH